MHSFSGRVCHQNEGVQQERRTRKEGLQQRKEAKRINRMIESEVLGEQWHSCPKETSPGWKKEVKSSRKEVFIDPIGHMFCVTMWKV